MELALLSPLRGSWAPAGLRFFINNSTVVNARYDIITDHCGAQQYAPFDRITGAIGLLPIQPQQPGYFGPPALQPQQPIY